MCSLLVWEQQGDWSAAQHYEGGGGLGGVKPEGAPGDEADGRVSTPDAAVGQARVDGGLDAVAVGADGAGQLDEGGQARALRPGAPACEQVGDLVAGAPGRNARAC